jgi:CheY-like chemotaxis protein
VADGNKNIAITFSCGNNLDKTKPIILNVSQEKQLAWKQYTFGINSDIKISDTKIQLIVPVILTKKNLSIMTTPQHDSYDKIITHNERKILCIEDNESNVKLIRKIIEKYFNNVNMISTYYGYMGMDIIENHEFDLILLDLNLPDIRGEQIIKHIRESNNNKECPVCIMSSESNNIIIEKCLSIGATHFIPKPLQIIKFKEIMEKYILSF